MKRIITAVGDESLNNILKEQKDIMVESSDIQYQEGITEALDKYPLTDIVILKDDIIGKMSLEDLILSIIIIKNNIEIILITEKGGFEENKNIIKIVNNNKNYVNTTIEYLLGNVYIKKENTTKTSSETIEGVNQSRTENEVIIQNRLNKMNIKKRIETKLRNVFKKNERRKEIITFIGNSGVRKNYYYFYII